MTEFFYLDAEGGELGSIMAYTFKDAHAWHLDAGCRLPFADEVPAEIAPGPVAAPRQAPARARALGLSVGVNRELRRGRGSLGRGLEPGAKDDARGSGSPSCGGGEYPVLSFISASEFALSFNISFFPFLLP